MPPSDSLFSLLSFEYYKQDTSSSQSLSTTTSSTSTTTTAKKTTITLKDANQRLDACMQVLLIVLLKDGGISQASIDEMQHHVQQLEYAIVLERSQQYLECVPLGIQETTSNLLVQAWQALVQRDAIQRKGIVKEWLDHQEILSELPRDEWNAQDAKVCQMLSRQAQIVAETFAASQWGLYQVQMYAIRLERRLRRYTL